MKLETGLIFLVFQLTPIKEIFAQNIPFGKFTNYRVSTSNYIVFYPDSTFKYSRATHLQYDISCGTFKNNNDTITLNYKTNITDTLCNTEKINIYESKDGKNIIIGTFTDTANRPHFLFKKGNKLYEITSERTIVFVYHKQTINYKPSKNERKKYHRKYFFFGPFIQKKRDAWLYKQ